MNDRELYELKSKVKKAEELKASMRKIDEILGKVKCGKCKEIKYEYTGPSVGGFGQMDDVGEGNYTYCQTISAETIGITDNIFSDWFTDPLINYLKECRNILQKQFDELK